MYHGFWSARSLFIYTDSRLMMSFRTSRDIWWVFFRSEAHLCNLLVIQSLTHWRFFFGFSSKKGVNRTYFIEYKISVCMFQAFTANLSSFMVFNYHFLALSWRPHIVNVTVLLGASEITARFAVIYETLLRTTYKTKNIL